MTSQTLSSDDRLDIIETVTGMGFHADIRNWDVLSSRYDDNIHLDYRSLFPEAEPFSVDHETLHNYFRDSLKYWDATQHILTNTQITRNDDGTVLTRTHARASHWKGGNAHVIGGYYSIGLRRTPNGWKIFSQRLDVLYEEDDSGTVKANWLASRKEEGLR